MEAIIRSWFAVAALLLSCGLYAESQSAVSVLETDLHEVLSQLKTDADFTLLVESEDGRRFVHSQGNSSAETVYRSASSSKMVTSAVVLALVDDGIMALNDHPQKYLDFWPKDGAAAEIQLRHLLSFTSGLNKQPLCINNPLTGFESCVKRILRKNRALSAPGSEYYYTGTHLQVAGLMAVRALGAEDWQAVFNRFQQRTGLFKTAEYDLPSERNPRLAGGMHWKATEYLEFLSALYHGKLLSAALLTAMTHDQLQGAPIVYSPVASSPLALDWHYGYGLWIECSSVPFNCKTRSRVSSPGAYGAYPFIDFEHRYFGIVAREGSLRTGHEGYRAWKAVAGELARWASKR